MMQPLDRDTGAGTGVRLSSIGFDRVGRAGSKARLPNDASSSDRLGFFFDLRLLHRYRCPFAGHQLLPLRRGG